MTNVPTWRTCRRRINVILKRLIAKQDDLRNATEDMEEIETFFRSQRTIFDAARKLENDLQNERDYFAADRDTSGSIGDIAAILDMPKPYGRIKDLSDLMQSVKAAYGVLLTQKKAEVLGIVQQCMGDVHTLAGTWGKASDEVKKSDDHFTDTSARLRTRQV